MKATIILNSEHKGATGTDTVQERSTVIPSMHSDVSRKKGKSRDMRIDLVSVKFSQTCLLSPAFSFPLKRALVPLGVSNLSIDQCLVCAPLK